ncbi:MgtC/SapB family protein [Camelliibacillus cellulosilyticus]|uniref:MgtC/SapB family protein n=1 Tax=Camelliibacillus cellulosilyticus TaxID=2174486 RepID=A0ABV9GSI2_9BACL
MFGGVIGLEREVKGHPAGFRTHLLVGVGSCLVMIVSIYGFTHYVNADSRLTVDISRMPASVVSGIGFLGAGTILVHGITVRGLTTAASIWTVSGIGMAVGVGMYLIAIITTIIVILSLLFLNKWEHSRVKGSKSHLISFYILTERSKLPISKVLEVMEAYNIRVDKFDIENASETGDALMYNFRVSVPDKKVLVSLFDSLAEQEAVLKIHTND